ncbi:hypothetical protein [Chryseobacterium sp. 5_R23647]|uniref:hypothetical protein n=1 Tax=Chryseobacterium sp. 5_R23647 TaxID=2258964 RepID=UPI000E23C754|nr:hypothetical protein [Chryseobacterium sp. 5_R23647]REC41779.1 hypothetical protein DRF69_13675 [Chryseobacterium sp. 5_R23647]
MKKLFIALSFLIVLNACEKKTNNVEIKKVDSSKILKDSAIATINKANTFMIKGVKKELSKKLVNKNIEPLMEKYEVYLSKLSPSDSIFVQNHRIKLINELIDLQMTIK